MLAKEFLPHVNLFAAKSLGDLATKFSALMLSIPFVFIFAWMIPTMTLFMVLFIPTFLFATMFFWIAIPLSWISMRLSFMATIFILIVSLAFYEPILNVWSESWFMYWGVFGWPFTDYSNIVRFLGDIIFVGAIMLVLSAILYFPEKWLAKLFDILFSILLKITNVKK